MKKRKLRYYKIVAGLARHEIEFFKNKFKWDKKPVLRKIYSKYYQLIRSQIFNNNNGKIIEIGSGIGAIQKIIPECILTDIFCHQGIDLAVNTYDFPFKENSVSNIILFDVFHHLKFPANILAEFERVLCTKGRVIIFEPYISLMGLFVFGFLHKEPVQWTAPINLRCSKKVSAEKNRYYAAQGNATRVFFSDSRSRQILKSWNIILKKRISGFSYILSGGYTGPQLYPDNAFEFLQKIDTVLDGFPSFFATRALIVLEKR